MRKIILYRVGEKTLEIEGTITGEMSVMGCHMLNDDTLFVVVKEAGHKYYASRSSVGYAPAKFRAFHLTPVTYSDKPDSEKVEGRYVAREAFSWPVTGAKKIT